MTGSQAMNSLVPTTGSTSSGDTGTPWARASQPDECVDCGACEPVCPVEAIFYEDDTPEEWKEYYNANVDFFSDLGSPGGAAKLGLIEKDHPLIAALPPQEHEE